MMNMSQKSISSRKMVRRGFMCQSQASTAVCMSTRGHGSVVVPRSRPADRSVSLDDSKLINPSKYSKLSESRRFRPVSLIKQQRAENHVQVMNQPRELHKPPTENVFQVVVMRVAIHCQGCAGKVKKHLLKMEGVTSISIDIESKRVTVMGHISPVGVLESISKVKKAELWAPSASSS
ncbi:hypothetical protein PIB30_052839 [Stylosanthes scabra]|uniref:HMA domain-containing protein n=1 Tax=Stylosanthes scabra TaxID=79078 RepID=A0ABU6RIN4_9FABA|nr:hypothetical protein [Stylosanthes scabra]